MSAYDSLRDYLRKVVYREIELTFREIENILGRPLPNSAELPQWWANTKGHSTHSQREAWRAAGFNAFLIRGARRVKFRRVAEVLGRLPCPHDRDAVNDDDATNTDAISRSPPVVRPRSWPLRSATGQSRPKGWKTLQT
jgi:hypothetical protein